MNKLARFGTPLLVTLAIGLAVMLTVMRMDGGATGLAQDLDTSAQAARARTAVPYDLTELNVIRRAILEVKDHYVDPDRVDYRRMFLAGLNGIQRTVAPVLVHYRESEGDVQVRVRSQTRSFRVSDINAPWQLTQRFGAAFQFLQAHLGDEEELDLRDVEYAAVNGMLRTLDPHTLLLTPDDFEEMQMNTRGEFGGLGIVISIRDGHLTIVKPIPNTPASNAGLLAGDRITQINDETTLNMPLSEAVDRLRGTPGSTVNLWYSRETRSTWSAPRRVPLERALIHIESVDSRSLGNGIGYIRLRGFQGNTHEDMRRALAELHRAGELNGLVLDLRDNPGGLLTQAARIVDTFLESGPIVTTDARDPRQRDEHTARRAGTEPNYPIVVLINGGSASASEIVAGALKNHNRALILGQQSFGKGSVQVLTNFADGSALKMTIAQYLTPGEVSIQGVGIVPDIAVTSMTVAREGMDLFVNERYLRESDLRAALTHDSARAGQQASERVAYYLPPDERRRLAEADPAARENEQEEEFLLRFAQQILENSRRPGRLEMLEDTAPIVQQARGEQMRLAEAALRELGVNWEQGTDGEANVEVALSTSSPDNVGRAGEDFELTVRVTNNGPHPVFQLRAVTKSDYRTLFNGREFVFGRVNPGETREWTTTLGVCAAREGEERSCQLPRDVLDRADGIRVEFKDAHGRAPAPEEIRVQLRSLPRPQFAHSVQVADDIEGNGDGRLQRGEQGSIYLRVKNVGDGPSFRLQANLRNTGGRGVMLRAGRFRLDPLAPGEEQLVRFTFEVMEDFEGNEAKFEASVIDTSLRQSMVERVVVPLAPPQDMSGATPGRGRIALNENATVREWPAANAPVVARATAAASVGLQLSLGEWRRVDLGDGRPGWVLASETAARGGARSGALRFVTDHQAPIIDVTTAGGVHVTRGDSIRVSGRARDDQRVRDVYIFSGSRKVFYDEAPQGARELSFNADVPLSEGINYITVFARESDEEISRQVIQVRRDAADGTLMETPRFDRELYDAVHE